MKREKQVRMMRGRGYFPPKVIAEAAGISARTVYQMLRDGRLAGASSFVLLSSALVYFRDLPPVVAALRRLRK